MINVLVGEMMLDFLIDAKCLQHREKKTKQQNNDLLLLWKHKDLFPLESAQRCFLHLI